MTNYYYYYYYYYYGVTLKNLSIDVSTFCNAIIAAVSLLETKYGLGDNESLHLSPCKAKPRQDAQYLDRG